LRIACVTSLFASLARPICNTHRVCSSQSSTVVGANWRAWSNSGKGFVEGTSLQPPFAQLAELHGVSRVARQTIAVNALGLR
jgi:uncharacterized protein (DUF736 family)